MSNDWMLDVLADLRSFADLNNMPRLANELELVAGVARDELHAIADPSGGALRDESVGRTLSRRVVAG